MLHRFDRSGTTLLDAKKMLDGPKMGSITERQRKNGSTAFLAQITIKRGGKIAHRENETFDNRKNAAAWIARREHELSQPGALERPDDPPLAAVIDRYIAESKKPIGRTKKQCLNTIKAMSIGSKRCSQIDSVELSALATELSKDKMPATVSGYLSHLSAVMQVARPAWGYPLHHQHMKDAFVVGKKLGITGKSKERTRRPTLEELDRVMDHFRRARLKTPQMNNMCSVVAFSIYSTRRMEETLRIEWGDLDEEWSRILVRDLKHPGEKDGNDQWLELPPEAMRIIKAQPKKDKRIFPYSTDAVGAAFTRAIQFLEIDDLHFHDLRHHGISRLFEMGRTIPQAAAVSGHRNWASMKRYTHIRFKGDCMAGWPWLEFVCSEKKKPA